MNSIEELPKTIKYLEGAIDILVALLPSDVDTDTVIGHMVAITDDLESDLLAIWRQRELDHMADVDALRGRIDELSGQVEKLKRKLNEEHGKRINDEVSKELKQTEEVSHD